jgi:TolB-like protein
MCEGLTNVIISHLFKVRSFDEVRPLTSVLRFKDSDNSTSEIFQELKVNYLLEGTYLRTGEMLKVTATLIEAHSGKMIWTQDYDTPYNQVMMIPGDIALQIANNLRAFMTEGEQQSIKRMPTNNLEAYEIGNQISYLFKRWTTGEVEDPFPQMTELCNRALELDPNYAEAYAYLGLVKVIGVGFAGGEEPLSIYWDANQFLNKALELDPYNLMANFGHTVLNYWIDWDYVALEEFKEAFPNALNNQFIAESLPLLELQMGHYNEALRMKDTLIDFRTDYLIKANILLGNYKEAKDLMKQVIASNFLGFMWYGYENYIWLQEFDSAIYYMSSDPSWEYSRSSEAYYPRFKADIAVVLFKTGNEDLARTIIGELIGASDTTAVRSPAYFTGWYYSWIQEPDSAFYWLNKAVKNRSIEIPWLKVDPAFNSLRNDPRWEDLYERTGHKAYDDYMASKKE